MRILEGLPEILKVHTARDPGGWGWSNQDLVCLACRRAWRGMFNAQAASMANAQPCPFCGSVLGPHRIRWIQTAHFFGKLAR